MSTAIHKPEGFIGYVVPHLSSSFNVQILLGVESILKEKGYHLIFAIQKVILQRKITFLKVWKPAECVDTLSSLYIQSPVTGA